MTAVDVLVIGGGQAGLSTARWLKRQGPSVLVVDAAKRIGDNWRKRYASLTLFTPRRYSSLPGLELSGDPADYASACEFADYLERYAEKFALPVRTDQRDVRLARSESGFTAHLASGEQVAASVVIIATGGFQSPVRPSMAVHLSADVQQHTVDSYRVAADVTGRSVLVVGDGATGRDVAAELAGKFDVALACGRPRRLLPETIFGISTWKWLRTLGLLNADTSSPVGRFMRRADPFPNRERDFSSLKKMGVELKPRATATNGRSVSFSDGSSLDVQTVIWALGYRDDAAWVDIPGALDSEGAFRHHHGRSPIPGIYFVGRPWQRNRASALIMGVGADARLITAEVSGSFGHDARTALERTLKLR